MVVLRQRAQPVENLVEQGLGAALLEDLAIDASLDVAESLSVDVLEVLVDRRGDHGGGAPGMPLELDAVEADAENTPPAFVPPEAGQQEVTGHLDILTADESGEPRKVPGAPLGNREQRLRDPAARREDSHTTFCRFEELEAFAQPVAKRPRRVPPLLPPAVEVPQEAQQTEFVLGPQVPPARGTVDTR